MSSPETGIPSTAIKQSSPLPLRLGMILDPCRSGDRANVGVAR